MPMKINIEYNSKGTKKLTVEYGSQLNIIERNKPVDFSKFLKSVKSGDISISYLGHGQRSVETQYDSPTYEILEEFLTKRENEFFKLKGTVKVTVDDKISSMDFYVESEISQFVPYNLRLQTNKDVAKQLDELLK